MTARTPRPHQTKTLGLLRERHLAGDRRVMLQMATGAGKTLLAAMIAEGTLSKKRRAIFCVPAVALVDQTVRAFWAEGLQDVGVIQANHHMQDFDAPLQVASVQTLARRGMGYVPPASVVMIDEAHCHFEFVTEWMNAPGWEEVPFIGLSATPWAKGLGKHYQSLVVGATTQELIDAGFLSPFRVFAPAHPDLTGVRVEKGEYATGQLAAVMGDHKLVAGVVDTWLELGENRPTLCFAVNRAHARKLQDQFALAGVASGYIDAKTPPNERRELEAAFARGEVKVVCNVGVLTKGVDWDVRCVIMARPVRSEMLYVQCIGRALRTAESKTDAIILDHADNTLRLGFVTDIHHPELDDGKGRKHGARDKEEMKDQPRECAKCHALRQPQVKACQECGFEPKVQSDIVEGEGKLVQVGGKAKPEPSQEIKQAWFSSLLAIRNERQYKPGWAAVQFKSKYGDWPSGLKDVAWEPLPEVRSYVVAQQIRWSKSQKKAKA